MAIEVITCSTLSLEGMEQYHLSIDESRAYQLVLVDCGYGFEFSDLSDLLLIAVMESTITTISEEHIRALRIKIISLMAQADKEAGNIPTKGLK